jgi:hypothetical protein
MIGTGPGGGPLAAVGSAKSAKTTATRAVRASSFQRGCDWRKNRCCWKAANRTGRSARAQHSSYGAGQGQQRGLAQDLRDEPCVTAAQAGEDRRLALTRRRDGLPDGGLQAHPAGPQPYDRLDEPDICPVVAAVTAGQAVRPREAVPVFPAAQRRRGHLGAAS